MNLFKKLAKWWNRPVSKELPYVPIHRGEEESLRDCIKRALNELGNTYEAVARKLVSMGVKGKMGDPRSCPVANYLKQACGEAITVGWGSSRSLSDPVYWEVPNPEAVKQFISNFDTNKLPLDLQAKLEA